MEYRHPRGGRNLRRPARSSPGGPRICRASDPALAWRLDFGRSGWGTVSLREVPVNWKTILTALAATALLCAPARAGSFGVYGSYWKSDQADHSAGGGGRVGFTFVKFLELDFHGTDYPSFTTDVNGQAVDVKAKPVDGGLRFNLLP